MPLARIGIHCSHFHPSPQPHPREGLVGGRPPRIPHLPTYITHVPVLLIVSVNDGYIVGSTTIDGRVIGQSLLISFRAWGTCGWLSSRSRSHQISFGFSSSFLVVILLGVKFTNIPCDDTGNTFIFIQSIPSLAHFLYPSSFFFFISLRGSHKTAHKIALRRGSRKGKQQNQQDLRPLEGRGRASPNGLV